MEIQKDRIDAFNTRLIELQARNSKRMEKQKNEIIEINSTLNHIKEDFIFTQKLRNGVETYKSYFEKKPETHNNILNANIKKL